MIRITVKAPSYQLEYEKKRLRSIFRRAGGEVASVAKAMISRDAGGGRTYTRDGRKYQASAPGESPVRSTGVLVGGIKVRPFKSGEGVAIRDNIFYALFLENGAKGGGRKGGATGKGKGARNKRGKPSTARVLLPRPFLTRALEAREPSIGARIRASIVQDIAFKRMRP